MPVELENKKDGFSIPVRQLKDGQIGVITEWGISDYIGICVQRIKNSLIQVGSEEINGWNPVPIYDHCRVQVLKNGTKLTITDNE